MRILFACTGFVGHGGIQRYNRNLVRALADLGVDVDVLALVDPAKHSVTQEREKGVVLVHGAQGSKSRWVSQLGRLLLTQRYSYCICGHINLGWIVAMALKVSGMLRSKRILILHGIEVWGRISGLKRIAAESFGRVLPVSTYTGESFLEQVAGFPRSALTVFPNTIAPELAALRLRRVPSLPDGPLRLLSVTRLARTERDKGILHVLEALHALKDRVAFRYTIIGDGDDRAFLQVRAAELLIADRVDFRGSLSDAELWEAYQCADVFVLPSRKEGFGIVFLEAMRFGLPIIAASEKGALDVVRQGVNGFLIQFGNVDELRQRLLELSVDEPLRARLGDKGQSLIEPGGEFSYEAFRERTRVCFEVI